MTWLIKAGQTLLKVVGFISGLTPLIGRTLPGEAGQEISQIGATVDQAFSVIQVAEAMFAATGAEKTGPQKLAAASPFIGKLLLSSETLLHAKIADQTKFNAAVTQITSSLSDLLNSLDANSLDTHQVG